MCQLEKRRLHRLRQVLKPPSGPIFVLPFRGNTDTLPAELAKRQPYEFDAYRDLANDNYLQNLPAAIAADVANWCNLFATHATEPTEFNCDSFSLPSEKSIKAKTIIEQQRNCGLKFPGRHY